MLTTDRKAAWTVRNSSPSHYREWYGRSKFSEFISWKLLNWEIWIDQWQKRKRVIGDPRLFAATTRCDDLWGLQSYIGDLGR